MLVPIVWPLADGSRGTGPTSIFARGCGASGPLQGGQAGILFTPDSLLLDPRTAGRAAARPVFVIRIPDSVMPEARGLAVPTTPAMGPGPRRDAGHQC
ncbi:MAG: hypothetical protein ACREN5_15470 [Gemmatimonadales bacterium]